MDRPIAFVTPRYGSSVVGGSETVSREIAFGLAARGHEIEFLTTCAVNHHTWESVLEPGKRYEDGAVVHRFETVPCPSRVGYRTHLNAFHGLPTTVDEQLGWLSFPFRVPGLFSHLLRQGDRYAAIVFSPYLFWTTTVCMPLVAQKAVVIPALHDEPWAHLEVMRPVLADPARVWFVSEPEHSLAHRLGPVAPDHSVTGEGLEVPDSYDPIGFRQRYKLERPFAVYAGRRESDKGWPWLLETFAQSLSMDDVGFDLVTVGGGDPAIPETLRGRVIDLGFVSPEERNNALAAASVYLQPSLQESFSRSTMEAWLAETPVLARQGGEVVTWHVERSGGGSVFSDAASLTAHLRRLVDRPDQSIQMAKAGRSYVLENYTWPVVLDRMEADLEAVAAACP